MCSCFCVSRLLLHTCFVLGAAKILGGSKFVYHNFLLMVASVDLHSSAQDRTSDSCSSTRLTPDVLVKSKGFITLSIP